MSRIRRIKPELTPRWPETVEMARARRIREAGAKLKKALDEAEALDPGAVATPHGYIGNYATGQMG